MGLRELIRRYGQMQAAPRGAAHRRGQRFNGLVADLLHHWGIDAEAGVHGVEGRDEIDVTFTLADTTYLLEAKWLAKPVSGDAATKLGSRIRQRLRGTRGIVLSMSGYTKHAASAVERGQQPEVLLLDRSHFEAMLSGLIPPGQLIQDLVRHASRRGGVHVPLADLLLPGRASQPPGFAPLPDDRMPWEVVGETAGGVTARVVLLGGPGWPAPSGLGAGRDGRLLIGTPDGVVEVDPVRGATRWAMPLPGCRATPATDADGSLITLCNCAVVRWRNGSVEIVGGGFTGNSNLLPGPNGLPWVFDSTGSTYARLVSLTGLGRRLGDQQSHVIDSDLGARNAGWMGRRRFFLAGDSYCAVVDLDVSGQADRATWMDSPQAGPRPMLVRDPTTVLTAAYDQGVRGSVYQTSLTSGISRRLAQLTINSVQGLAALGDEAFILADVRGNETEPRPIIVQLSGVGPLGLVDGEQPPQEGGTVGSGA